MIYAAYQLLGLQTYFTAGVKEVRAWTVRRGATAPQAAAVIHTDFEKGFIRAETIAYDDFIKYKGEAGAKEAGRLRLEGKEYRVQEGDILHFRFNVYCTSGRIRCGGGARPARPGWRTGAERARFQAGPSPVYVIGR